MKTASRMPVVSAAVPPSIANGENHVSCGCSEPASASPEYTRTSATRANSPSVSSSAPSRPTCVRADSSMPIVVIAVMTMIHTTPTAVTAATEPAADSQPTSLNEYRPAIWARFAMTTTSATMIAQPPSQPAHGPIALVTHANVVPQSGSMRFMYRYALAMQSIGTNATH